MDGDWKAFSLVKQPVAELKYSLTGIGFDENTGQPFRRNVHLRADYYITVRVTVTLDRDAITRETQSVASGVASQTPADHTFKSAISLTDRKD